MKQQERSTKNFLPYSLTRPLYLSLTEFIHQRAEQVSRRHSNFFFIHPFSQVFWSIKAEPSRYIYSFKDKFLLEIANEWSVKGKFSCLNFLVVNKLFYFYFSFETFVVDETFYCVIFEGMNILEIVDGCL